jgi:hypothetical protein
MELADHLRITGIGYQLAELAAVAGNEDGACGGTQLDRLSDRASLPCAATAGFSTLFPIDRLNIDAVWILMHIQFTTALMAPGRRTEKPERDSHVRN